ncbi:MAG: hypothetical protein K6F57_00250 [Candidatus Saccharibacteria bacterium]|nr:hypothetical protein [Candidatus Saccharibacteria bacterium]
MWKFLVALVVVCCIVYVFWNRHTVRIEHKSLYRRRGVSLLVLVKCKAFFPPDKPTVNLGELIEDLLNEYAEFSESMDITCMRVKECLENGIRAEVESHDGKVRFLKVGVFWHV